MLPLRYLRITISDSILFVIRYEYIHLKIHPLRPRIHKAPQKLAYFAKKKRGQKKQFRK